MKVGKRRTREPVSGDSGKYQGLFEFTNRQMRGWRWICFFPLTKNIEEEYLYESGWPCRSLHSTCVKSNSDVKLHAKTSLPACHNLSLHVCLPCKGFKSYFCMHSTVIYSTYAVHIYIDINKLQTALFLIFDWIIYMCLYPENHFLFLYTFVIHLREKRNKVAEWYCRAISKFYFKIL